MDLSDAPDQACTARSRTNARRQVSHHGHFSLSERRRVSSTHHQDGAGHLTHRRAPPPFLLFLFRSRSLSLSLFYPPQRAHGRVTRRLHVFYSALFPRLSSLPRRRCAHERLSMLEEKPSGSLQIFEGSCAAWGSALAGGMPHARRGGRLDAPASASGVLVLRRCGSDCSDALRRWDSSILAPGLSPGSSPRFLDGHHAVSANLPAAPSAAPLRDASEA